MNPDFADRLAMEMEEILAETELEEQEKLTYKLSDNLAMIHSAGEVRASFAKKYPETYADRLEPKQPPVFGYQRLANHCRYISVLPR